MNQAQITEVATKAHIKQCEQQVRMDALNLAHRLSGSGMVSVTSVVDSAKKLLAFVKAK